MSETEIELDPDDWRDWQEDTPEVFTLQHFEVKFLHKMLNHFNSLPSEGVLRSCLEMRPEVHTFGSFDVNHYLFHSDLVHFDLGEHGASGFRLDEDAYRTIDMYMLLNEKTTRQKLMRGESTFEDWIHGIASVAEDSTSAALDCVDYLVRKNPAIVGLTTPT